MKFSCTLVNAVGAAIDGINRYNERQLDGSILRRCNHKSTKHSYYYLVSLQSDMSLSAVKTNIQMEILEENETVTEDTS